MNKQKIDAIRGARIYFDRAIRFDVVFFSTMMKLVAVISHYAHIEISMREYSGRSSG